MAARSFAYRAHGTADSDKSQGLCAQELMSAAKRREGASNYRTLFVPTSVESRTLNFG